MSADIEKLAVFDSRIVQTRPKYAVYKGALSLTNAPFNAISATPSQHTYNIYVPSENVYVERGLEWSSTVNLTFRVSLSAVPVVGESVVVAGRDWSLCAFPLNSLCSTLTATINDTTTVINSNDVLKEVLRLTDYKKNRLQRTCPTKLDTYQNYNDGFGAVNNPLAGYEYASEAAEMPNGAFYNVRYTSPNGALLGTAAPAYAGARYDAVNGQPVANAATIADQAAGNPIDIYVQFTSTEKLVLSPFVFAECHEWDTGLFGINNIQLIMNLQSPSRLIRNCQGAGRNIALSTVAYTPGVQSPFINSVVNVQFLTPSLDVPLPPKSVVPYMEFPRYITQYQNGTIAPGATGQIISQTITLPQIPDLFIIYAKPSASCRGVDGAGNPLVYPQSYDADWRFPVATRYDSVANPLTVNFDNFSGLLSSVTAEQLYAMSVRNGLDMDYNSWVGAAHSSRAQPAVGTSGVSGGSVPTCGSILVLKPSQDITLQTGQAPSLVGNFTFQFNLTVKNTSANPQVPQLFVITANSGFFESIRGSSRIIKGVLSEQDIISAPLAPEATTSMLSRYVGAGGIGGALANVMSKARSAMMPPAGSGKAGAGMAGGGRSGAGLKGLQARLM